MFAHSWSICAWVQPSAKVPTPMLPMSLVPSSTNTARADELATSVNVPFKMCSATFHVGFA